MTYEKLVKALRHCSKDKCGLCEYKWNHNRGICVNSMCADAAAAIEALNNLVSLNTERCDGLRKQLREAQEQYEKHLNDLEQMLQQSSTQTRQKGAKHEHTD